MMGGDLAARGNQKKEKAKKGLLKRQEWGEEINSRMQDRSVDIRLGSYQREKEQ